jgi:hypothetical protein
MSVLNFRSSLFAIVAVALIGQNNEFAEALAPSKSSRSGSAFLPRSAFPVARMTKDNFDGAQITSARKELKFDDKTGRFFETDLELEDCIPDEEYCAVDDDTGNRIRLTMAEKERIFLDSLQVCALQPNQISSHLEFCLETFFFTYLSEQKFFRQCV